MPVSRILNVVQQCAHSFRPLQEVCLHDLEQQLPACTCHQPNCIATIQVFLVLCVFSGMGLMYKLALLICVHASHCCTLVLLEFDFEMPLLGF